MAGWGRGAGCTAKGGRGGRRRRVFADTRGTRTWRCNVRSMHDDLDVIIRAVELGGLVKCDIVRVAGGVPMDWCGCEQTKEKARAEGKTYGVRESRRSSYSTTNPAPPPFPVPNAVP